MFGGTGLQTFKDFNELDFELRLWTPLPQKSSEILSARYGHSLVHYKDKVFLFGGVIKSFR
jgi:hypothetical protein